MTTARSAWPFKRSTPSYELLHYVVPALVLVACLWTARFNHDRSGARRSTTPASNATQPSMEMLSMLDTQYVDDHIRTLSSDEFEGRAVGAAGERLTVEYIAKQFQAYGLQGAAQRDGEGLEAFYQNVPLQGVTTRAAHLKFRSTRESAQPDILSEHGADSALTTDLPSGDRIQVEADDIIFGGYCIHALEPPYQWDDFAGVDVRGQVVMCLVNQPEKGCAFGGKHGALTYYGRWTYKLEELRRRGAKGALLVHTTESAGYGWQVIDSWAATENLRLHASTDESEPLQVRGWVSSELVNKLYPPGVAALQDEANRRGFTPRSLGISLSSDMHLERRHLNGMNVVGELPPPQRNRSRTNHDESVVVTAHHDHFGVRPLGGDADEGTDRTFNGALDNASGVGKLLELARIFGNLYRGGHGGHRRLVFIAPTAEENVLLGSTYYAAHPSAAPLHSTVAIVNFDGMNIWGRTHDVVGLGSELSSLGSLLAEAASHEQMNVEADAEPGQGLFYRSDQFPFALRGVPALKLCHGKNYIGRENDPDYFKRMVGKYNEERYHQVNDDYEYIHSHDDPYSGALQEVRVAFRILYGLWHDRARPRWLGDHSFSRAREVDLARQTLM